MSNTQGITVQSMGHDEQAADEVLSVAAPDLKEARRQLLSIETELVGELARAADDFVRQNRFTERQRRKAWNTVRKEIAALSDFMAFIETPTEVELSFHLAEEPRLWSAITFGLVETFLEWERKRGYTIQTLNDHLGVIKRYAKLAHQAGFQTTDQLLAIQHIERIRGAEGERIDADRAKTRLGHKKAEPTFLERAEFKALLGRPDTPQGWRDRVAILLMYDLSLRPSEVVSLKVADVNMQEGTVLIKRHKTNDQQRARLKDRLYTAMTQYLRRRADLSPDAPLIVRSRKDGELIEKLPLLPPEVVAAKQGGRRPNPRSVTRRIKARLHPGSGAATLGEQESDAGQEKTWWTPTMTTRGLREHLHNIGLDIADDLYGEHEGDKKPPRTRRQKPEKTINLTSYDGRHEWTRNAIRGGSNPVAVTKAGGWKGHSAMVARYYGELEIVNEDIVFER